MTPVLISLVAVPPKIPNSLHVPLQSFLPNVTSKASLFVTLDVSTCCSFTWYIRPIGTRPISFTKVVSVISGSCNVVDHESEPLPTAQYCKPATPTRLPNNIAINL